MWPLLLFLVLFVVLIILVMYYNKQTHTDYFQTMSKSGNCMTNADCPYGYLCHNGHCWSYWNGLPMPWNNCRDPYNPTGVLPYCACVETPQPGYNVAVNCFPKCGTPCLQNSDCPPGCPQCDRHGTCQAPNLNNGCSAAPKNA